MNSVWTFRSTMGLFAHGKWRPLISAIINIVVSIWWANEWGIMGVLLGTTFTRVVTNVWYDPFIVYKHGLHKRPYKYYLKWLLYLAVTLVDILIIKLFTTAVPLSGIIAILVYGFTSVLTFTFSVVVIFGKTDEFKYFITIFKKLILKKNKS